MAKSELEREELARSFAKHLYLGVILEQQLLPFAPIVAAEAESAESD